jgi:DNA-binding response OmpR family regulator
MKGTILLVDDEPVIRDLTTRALNRKGYDVVAAATLQEARHRADHDDPDLLLIDALRRAT